MKSPVADHWKLTMTSWEDHRSWSSYNYVRSCPWTQHWPFLGCLAFEAYWKGKKAQWMCVSWADCKSKILSFWSVVLSYSIKQPFLNQIVMCNGKWILYNNQLSGWTEKKLQSTSWSQICTKKRVVITVWWSAARLIHYSFLNPRESIVSEKYAQQIDEMHQKLQCLQPALVNRKGPILLYNNAQPLVTQPVL